MKTAAIFLVLMLSVAPAFAEKTTIVSLERIQPPVELSQAAAEANLKELHAREEAQRIKNEATAKAADEKWRTMPAWKKAFIKAEMCVIGPLVTVQLLNEFFGYPFVPRFLKSN